jgi:plasmid stabilization system protein ParE
MSYLTQVSPEAEEDIRSAAMWYESKRKGLGIEFVDRVDKVIERLSRHPEIHAKTYLDVRQTLVRKFPYTVCYGFENEAVEIIAVFHAHRDPQAWQLRRLGE